MDHNRLISQALRLTRGNKVLWIFGALLSLSLGIASFEFGLGTGQLANTAKSVSELVAALPSNEFTRTLSQEIADSNVSILHHFGQSGSEGALESNRLIGVAGLALAGLLSLFALGIGLMARAAIIRMVDAHLRQENLGLASGIDLGRDTRTGRLLSLDIVGFLLLAVFILPIGLLGNLPAVYAQNPSETLTLSQEGQAVTSILAGLSGLSILLIFLAFRFLQQLWAREVLIDNAPLGVALAESFGMLRRQPLRIGMLWLAIGLSRLAYFLIILPVFALVLAITAGVTSAVTSAMFESSGSALSAALAGMPAALLLLGIPHLLLWGIFRVFESSAWTLAWYDLKAKQTAN